VTRSHQSFAPRPAVWKRCLDLAIAASASLALAPVFGLIGLAVRLTMGSPVLFRQVRPGLHGEPFTMLKFRTMTNARDSQGHLLPDSERLTRLGRFLRATSLDELPELLNVLKGEMSMVGPRPLLMAYLPLYTPEQMRRHDVRPGLTGWAQVNGRNATTWDERFAHDVWYVDNVSLSTDMLILARTILVVLKQQGVTHDSMRIMPRFTGSARSRE
jgi:sugar transferase EpsL